MNFNIPDELIDRLIESLTITPYRWTMDKDLLIHEQGIFIGNFANPNCLIIHIDGLKYGVTSGTISEIQAQKLCNVTSDLAAKTYDSHVTGILARDF